MLFYAILGYFKLKKADFSLFQPVFSPFQTQKDLFYGILAYFIPFWSKSLKIGIFGGKKRGHFRPPQLQETRFLAKKCKSCNSQQKNPDFLLGKRNIFELARVPPCSPKYVTFSNQGDIFKKGPILPPFLGTLKMPIFITFQPFLALFRVFQINLRYF